MAAISASSAAGSWKTWPAVAMAETPRRGMKRVTGPRAWFSFWASRFPNSAHSAGVVRIRVTVGLCW